MSLATDLHFTSSDATLPPGQWVTAWHASSQGPFPIGNNALQPPLDRAMPGCETCDQAFRMVLPLSLPHVSSPQLRFRFSNALGSTPLCLADVSTALHAASAHIDAASQQRLTFGGKDTLVLEPGAEYSSDGVVLPWLPSFGGSVCVTFVVRGRCDRITWHAKAMTTSYVAPPCSGRPPPDAGDEFFVYSCTSWFFLCGIDVWSTGGDQVVAVLGDSIADGTNSTINGCDKWPDILSRFVNRLGHDQQPRAFTHVINCGIGGNSICHPPPQHTAPAHRGGVAGATRMLQEVLRLQGLTFCIWSQGINDFSTNTGASSATVISSVTAAVAEARLLAPLVKFIGCTVASALGSTCGGHGGVEQDTERRAFNRWLLDGAAPFDHVIDFDAVSVLLQRKPLRSAILTAFQLLTCPATGRLRPEYDCNTSVTAQPSSLLL
jgi:hypothetical protein